MINEHMKQLAGIQVSEAKKENPFTANNSLRYIPTGSEITTAIRNKSMTFIIKDFVGSPFIINNIGDIESRLKASRDMFFKDLLEVFTGLDIKPDTYIFVSGEGKQVGFSIQFRLEAKTKSEAKKFDLLEQALRENPMTKKKHTIL